jgi:serine-type D-Ala-D-Ala carboxypeptidase/endopeptidase (penicillin-binding protein 4)
MRYKDFIMPQLRKTILQAITGIAFGFFLITNAAAFFQSRITEGIDQILRRNDPNLSIGIQVQSLNNNQILYQKNANQLFTPASTMKVFTAAAALSYLGPDYKFQTKMFAVNRTVNQGVLHSDIYFAFDGDPMLHRSDLNNFIKVLSRLGITAIQGNIYLDDTAFDQKVSGPGWMWDERNFAYAAPTSAITIDKNAFPLQITAPRAENKYAKVATSKAYSSIKIYSSLISRYGSYDDCPLDLRATGDNNYYLFGCIRPRTPTMRFSVAVRNPRLLAKNVLLELLQSNKISFQGQIKFAPIPSNNLSLIAYHESPPLSALVKRMLKKSDNLVADAIFKKIGNIYYHKTGTWKNSAKAVAAILGKSTGINFNKMKMVDGSGLSRYNLASPAQINAVLRFAFRDPKIRAQFYTSLPSSGKDGTMAYRLGRLLGRVHAKTGNMANISSLAGYVVTNSQQVLIFTIILNDFLSKPHKYHKLQDDICKLLAAT